MPFHSQQSRFSRRSNRIGKITNNKPRNRKDRRYRNKSNNNNNKQIIHNLASVQTSVPTPPFIVHVQYISRSRLSNVEDISRNSNTKLIKWFNDDNGTILKK